MVDISSPIKHKNESENLKKSSLGQWIKKNAVTLSLFIVFAIGLTVTGFVSIKNEYIPENSKVIAFNSTDADVVLTVQDNMLIPLQSFLNRRESNVTVEIYPIVNMDPKNIKVRLYPNSSSFLTIDKDIGYSKELNQGTSPYIYTGKVKVGHPLEISTFTQRHILGVFYYKHDSSTPLNNRTTSNLQKIIIPFDWTIRTLDFSKPSYFWIIFVGVLVSRIFSFSQNDKESAWVHLKGRELLWVPFSAIITLLIFSSFREQVQLTTDVMTNLALAFGFGFGFDKVFEVWHKSPAKATDTTSSATQTTK